MAVTRTSEDYSPETPFSSLELCIHSNEVEHELLHKTDRRTQTTVTIRETEAEAVAFIVGQGIGLGMGRASSDYIQMYAGNTALLVESLEVVQRTSAVILAAITVESVTVSASEAGEPIAEVA